MKGKVYKLNPARYGAAGETRTPAGRCPPASEAETSTSSVTAAYLTLGVPVLQSPVVGSVQSAFAWAVMILTYHQKNNYHPQTYQKVRHSSSSKPHFCYIRAEAYPCSQASNQSDQFPA